MPPLVPGHQVSVREFGRRAVISLVLRLLLAYT